MLGGALALGACSDEAEPDGPGSGDPAGPSTAVSIELQEDQRASAETAASLAGTWTASYDGRPVVLEGVPASSDSGWRLRAGGDSEWEVKGVSIRSGKVAFDLERGGLLTGKLVRFEGAFDAARDELRGRVYDGARSRLIVFARAKG